MEATAATGTHLWFFDTLAIVRVGQYAGRDGIAVLERLAPHADSPPLHIHYDEDEVFYVLEGELRIQAGDADARIGPGEAMLAPSGIPHTYRVESSEGARWLNITTHGDFVRFMVALSRPAERIELPAPQGPPTPEQAEAVAASAREHGIEFVGPPLAS
jgi:mannose-6-phosphate isomerase-like protein (cupin superfamily)